MDAKLEGVLKVTKEVVQVFPKTGYLSASELTTLRNSEIPTVSAGLKRTKVENTPEEQNELEKLYDNLQSQLSRPRIERLFGRAVGVWDPEKNLVRVDRKDGKFGNFGFSIDGKLYLEYYEALFLLEVNRLHLESNSTHMSIEQAYLLLMGEQDSPKYHEYVVYSHLTRAGYILVKHQNIHFQKHQINTEVDCVWAILEAEVQNESVADYVKKSTYYPKVKQNFDRVKNKIINQKDALETRNIVKEETGNNSFAAKVKPTLKRTSCQENHCEWSSAKRRCNYTLKGFQHSLVDFLKEEEEYKQFKEQFEKFDLVQLKSNDTIKQMEDVPQASKSKLHINFDVYLHNEGFRKSSPHLPQFRVSILQPQQRFPTHDEIFIAHRQQLNPVPLLIVNVNESKQIHAFLYYFS